MNSNRPWHGSTREPRTKSDHQTSIRPLRATRVATPRLPDDPDLAAVVAAWPDLPDALRAGILAIIKAAAPPHA